MTWVLYVTGKSLLSSAKEEIVFHISEEQDLENSECYALVKKCLEMEDETDSSCLSKYSLQLFIR